MKKKLKRKHNKFPDHNNSHYEGFMEKWEYIHDRLGVNTQVVQNGMCTERESVYRSTFLPTRKES